MARSNDANEMDADSHLSPVHAKPYLDLASCLLGQRDNTSRLLHRQTTVNREPCSCLPFAAKTPAGVSTYAQENNTYFPPGPRKSSIQSIVFAEQSTADTPLSPLMPGHSAGGITTGERGQTPCSLYTEELPPERQAPFQVQHTPLWRFLPTARFACLRGQPTACRRLDSPCQRRSRCLPPSHGQINSWRYTVLL